MPASGRTRMCSGFVSPDPAKPTPAAMLVLAAVLIGAAGQAAPSLEWAVKAEYLFKLVPFVEWPQDAFASPGEPFRLCIVGDDPFGPLLDEAGQGQTAGERQLTVVRLKTVAPDQHCQLMYIAGDPQFVAQTLDAVNGRPVLTVTDAQNGRKGIINFVRLQNHVRFQVDQDAATKNHLNVSSKLLVIAAATGNAR